MGQLLRGHVFGLVWRPVEYTVYFCINGQFHLHVYIPNCPEEDAQCTEQPVDRKQISPTSSSTLAEVYRALYFV